MKVMNDKRIAKADLHSNMVLLKLDPATSRLRVKEFTFQYGAT